MNELENDAQVASHQPRAHRRSTQMNTTVVSGKDLKLHLDNVI